MDEEIKEDDVFEHIETGQCVIVVGTGSMKEENHDWYDTVTYRNPEGDKPDHLWTRTKFGFISAFRRV
jgi:hypothetical protein